VQRCILAHLVCGLDPLGDVFEERLAAIGNLDHHRNRLPILFLWVQV
jgi:hypothetical protein